MDINLSNGGTRIGYTFSCASTITPLPSVLYQKETCNVRTGSVLRDISPLKKMMTSRADGYDDV